MTEGEDASGACRLITMNPTLRQQAEEMLPMLEAAKAPAEDREILRVLIRHAPTYALPTRPEGEWENFFGVYLDALVGLSVHALEDAFLRWNRGEDMKDPAMGQFFPKPAQLFALAQKAKTEVWMAAYRARKALEHVEKQGAEWTPARRAEERKKMIEAGYLNADGTPNLILAPKVMPEMSRPRVSPQQMAEQLRRTDAQARQGGAPISRRHIEAPADDVGDVL